MLGGGEEGQAGVLHAVGPEAGVLALVGEGDGVEAGARLGLEAVGAQQAAVEEVQVQRQTAAPALTVVARGVREVLGEA